MTTTPEPIKLHHFPAHTLTDGHCGYVLHSDHVAARAADKAEIERLQKNCTRWRRVADHHVNVTERFQARAEKAEARIAELEAGHTLWISFNEGVVWNVGQTQKDVEIGAEIVRQYREVPNSATQPPR